MLLFYHLFVCFLFMLHAILLDLFFFSSRRRHTRCLSDWSSDVCSSDLADAGRRLQRQIVHGDVGLHGGGAVEDAAAGAQRQRVVVSVRGDRAADRDVRSEERRVGNERTCRWRWSLASGAADEDGCRKVL